MLTTGAPTGHHDGQVDAQGQKAKPPVWVQGLGIWVKGSGISRADRVDRLRVDAQGQKAKPGGLGVWLWVDKV